MPQNLGQDLSDFGLKCMLDCGVASWPSPIARISALKGRIAVRAKIEPEHVSRFLLHGRGAGSWARLQMINFADGNDNNIKLFQDNSPPVQIPS